MIDGNEVKMLVGRGESDTVEFKQQWWDLSHKEGKAQLAKCVLALANSVRPQHAAHLIIGVGNRSEIVGVDKGSAPNAEQVSAIVASYVHPPADVACRHIRIGQKLVGVVRVAWSPARPHHSLKQHEGILEMNRVYARADRITRVLTLTEIELMFRQKDQYLGPLVSREPLEFGFVDLDTGSGKGVTLRVSNVSTEPVSGVSVMLDARNARNPEIFCRQRKLLNATLLPNESREMELQPTQGDLYLSRLNAATGDRDWTTLMDFGRHLGDSWLDLTFHVDYRDRNGFIQHREQRIALGG